MTGYSKYIRYVYHMQLFLFSLIHNMLIQYGILLYLV